MFIIVTILFQLYYWFKVKNKELSQIYLITTYMIFYLYLNEIYFCLNYDLIYMILDNLTIFWLWYLVNEGYLLVLWYPANEGLFISTKNSSIWGITSLSCFWTQLKWGIYISMELVSSESDAQSQGYSVTIVIKIVKNMNYVEYLNWFKSLKLFMCFWNLL